MLTTFKSQAGPNVMMFEDVASQLLGVMGKDDSSEGIVTVEQMPDVLSRLRRLGELEGLGRDGRKPTTPQAVDRRSAISLATRAQPLIDLIERSQRAQLPVVWS